MTTLTGPSQEVIATPLTLYFAPVGTAAPAIDATATQITAGGWTLIGANGNLDYDPAGLTISHNQTVALWTPVGSTAPTHVWRTNEQLEVAVTLADTSSSAYALALNSVATTTVSATTGVAGEIDVPLLQGNNVSTFALLCVGISAINNAMQAMYAIPIVYQAANPAPVYKLGAPAELALTFATLLDPNGGGFGQLRQQNAAKT